MNRLILFLLYATFFWQAACNHRRDVPNKSKFTVEQNVYQGAESTVRTSSDDAYSYIPEVTVYFDYDEYDLDVESKNKLQIFYQEQLAKDSISVYYVEGNTDSSGPNAYNMTLSENRANEVINYLTALGANTNQFRLLARGELNPIADDSVHPELNRRVIVYRQSKN